MDLPEWSMNSQSLSIFIYIYILLLLLLLLLLYYTPIIVHVSFLYQEQTYRMGEVWFEHPWEFFL